VAGPSILYVEGVCLGGGSKWYFDFLSASQAENTRQPQVPKSKNRTEIDAGVLPKAASGASVKASRMTTVTSAGRTTGFR